MKNLIHTFYLVFVILLFNQDAKAQIPYAEFKASYTPHNKPGISTANEGVKAGNSMQAPELAKHLEQFVIERNTDVFNALITSIRRALAGSTLDNMEARHAIQGLNWLKDEWVYEVIWYMSERNYTIIAPYLNALKNYKGDPKGASYSETKKWHPVYATVGLDAGFSGFKGINVWVDAYNNSPVKTMPNGGSGTLTTPMKKMHWQRGFGLSTGLKVNENTLLEIYYSNRSALVNGVFNDGLYTRGVKYSASFMNIGMMKKIKSGKLNVYAGVALVGAFGSIKARLDNGTTKGDYTKIINSPFKNVGFNFSYTLQYKLSDKLPLMLSLRPYYQMNLIRNDFIPLNKAIPNVFDLSQEEKMKSRVGNLGVQIGVSYSFQKKRKVPEVKEYPTEYTAKLNTIFEELNPIISPDGKTIYFSRNNDPRNTTGGDDSQDIWMANVENGVENAKAVHLTAPFNKSKYNYMAGISPDENTIMISGSYTNGVMEGKGYSLMYRTRTGWTEPQKMVIEGFGEMCKGNYAGAMLSNDGKYLLQYFSEVSGTESYDLYVSRLKADGTWTRPMKLGNLNTKDNDMSPFLAADGVTLYFSSNRSGGKGSNDIYMSKRLDDTWMNWSEPVNMGSEVNTEGWDAYYCVDAQGQYAYKVSYVPGNGSDIVRIPLKKEVQPDPVVLVKGRVLNGKTMEPLEATVTYVSITGNGQSGIARTNPANGEYKIVLPYGSEYSFLGEAKKFVSVSNNLNLTKKGEYIVIERDIILYPLEVGSTVRLNNLFFETGKANLDDKSQNELERLVTLLNENPNMEMEISGHTDNVGSADLNKKLSQDRANAVVAYLVGKGINTKRLKAVGYGMNKPVGTNDTDEGKAQNRRVEFTITKS